MLETELFGFSGKAILIAENSQVRMCVTMQSNGVRQYIGFSRVIPPERQIYM